MKRIAVIDDEFLVGQSFIHLLKVKGYETAYFDSADSYLQSGLEFAADCLVIDFRMPEMNGGELVAVLRKQGIRTPALILSGRMDTATSRLLEAQVNVVTLLKPCLSEDFFKQIQVALALMDHDD